MATINWLNSGPSDRWLENRKIIELIGLAFEESYQSYGSPRMAVELEKRESKVSRPRISRMMKSMGIVARRKRKFKKQLSSISKYL